MFDKLKFNNFVITNKKKIQQGRVQTINRLVHKIRKLKTLLERNNEDEKLKKRLNKCTAVMEQLKKLKRLEIVKRILLLEKTPTSFLTNDLSVPEELAVASLALNKIIAELIYQVRLEFELNDGDATWKTALMTQSKRREKILKTEEKREKRKKLKEQKALEHKRHEWLKENRPGLQGDESSSNVFSASGTWLLEDVSTTVPQTEKPTKPRPSVRKSEKNTNKKSVPCEERPKNAKEQPSKQFTRLEPMKENKIKREKLVASTKVDEVTHVIDPFFITAEGKNYLSTAVIKEPAADVEEHVPAFQYKTHQHQQNGNDKSIISLRKRNDLKGLHPSWAAKQQQQQKSALSSFKGKKIKFNDASQPFEMENANDSKSSKNEVITPKMENLHPSWAAKQKMKPVITAFQGKKITFADE